MRARFGEAFCPHHILHNLLRGNYDCHPSCTVPPFQAHMPCRHGSHSRPLNLEDAVAFEAPPTACFPLWLARGGQLFAAPPADPVAEKKRKRSETGAASSAASGVRLDHPPCPQCGKPTKQLSGCKPSSGHGPGCRVYKCLECSRGCQKCTQQCLHFWHMVPQVSAARSMAVGDGPAPRLRSIAADGHTASGHIGSPPPSYRHLRAVKRVLWRCGGRACTHTPGAERPPEHPPKRPPERPPQRARRLRKERH